MLHVTPANMIHVSRLLSHGYRVLSLR